MIAAMRPDIDNIDEYVRNTTARAFSVVASALGVPALLPFLKAVCLSKKSWQVRSLPRLGSSDRPQRDPQPSNAASHPSATSKSVVR